jgi:hypothetical protein
MILRTLLAAILATALAACTSLQMGESPGARQPSYPPDTFAHRVATSHLVLFWNCSRPETNLLRLDGVVHNPWSSQPVRFVEFELVGVNGEDRIVSETKGEVRDITISTNQISPFSLDLRTMGGEARFDLYYGYQYEDADLDALLAGPPAAGSRLLAWTNRFLARDVCSETQHRAR